MALLSLALSLALLSLFTLTSYVPHGPTVPGPVPIHPVMSLMPYCPYSP